MTSRRRAAWTAALLLLVFAAAHARVGGGQGYSGGGGDSGFGGGDGGDGALVYLVVRLLLWLVFEHPIIGIPLAILVVVFLIKFGGAGWHAGAAGPPIVITSRPAVAPSTGTRPPPDLSPLVASDPNFSEPLFVDFAQLVFARAQAARGAGNEDLLTAWVSKEAVPVLMARREGLQAVRDVIFGATTIAAWRRQGFFDVLDVDFDANVTEVRDGGDNPYLVRERWSFRKRSGTLSPGPERMRALGCAGCGSALEPKADGTCPSCGGARRGGLTHWEVATIAPFERRALPPPELRRGGGVEPGTNRPTVVDPRLPAAKRQFDARHPDHRWDAFEAKVVATFIALQRAWSEGRWEPARPLETDALFQTHRFWMERYRSFGLRNRVENTAVQRVELARIVLDAFYEAVTVRIYASALDWTEDAGGKVVGGSRDEPRAFSEYWTFLRAVGARRREDAGPASCPACAAPLDGISMAGICAYCGAKLTTGAFDWVVSRIEQDDAY